MKIKFNEESFNLEVSRICDAINESHRESSHFNGTIVIGTNHLNVVAYTNKNGDICFPIKLMYETLKNNLPDCFVQYDEIDNVILIGKKGTMIEYDAFIMMVK